MIEIVITNNRHDFSEDVPFNDDDNDNAAIAAVHDDDDDDDVYI